MDANRKNELLMAIVASEIYGKIEPLNSPCLMYKLARLLLRPIFYRCPASVNEMLELYADIAAHALEVQLSFQKKPTD